MSIPYHRGRQTGIRFIWLNSFGNWFVTVPYLRKASATVFCSEVSCVLYIE